MKYLDFQKINYFFSNYKKRPTSHNLNSLYTELDPLVVDVTNNISKNFRSRNPEDFEDLQQQTRMEVFNVLDKIVNISFTGEQLAKILVKVIIYSFIDSYKEYKKERYIKLHGMEETTYAPFVPIQEVAGERDVKYADAPMAYKKAEIFINPGQEHSYYLNILRFNIEEKIKERNRYKDKQDIILFCFDSLFNSRDISPKIIQKIWNIKEASFFLDYTEILLKTAVYDELYSESK